MAASSDGYSQLLATSSGCGGLLMINQMINHYIEETDSWLQSIQRYIQHPYDTISEKLQHLHYIAQEVEARKININRIYRNLLMTEFNVRHDLSEDTIVEFRSRLPGNHQRDDTLAMRVDRMLVKIKKEVDLCYEEREFGYLCSNLCATLASSPQSSKLKKQSQGSNQMC